MKQAISTYRRIILAKKEEAEEDYKTPSVVSSDILEMSRTKV